MRTKEETQKSLNKLVTDIAPTVDPSIVPIWHFIFLVAGQIQKIEQQKQQLLFGGK